jgi:UPF0755 protein
VFKKIIALSSILLTCLLVGFFVVKNEVTHFMHQPLSLEQPSLIKVSHGQSLQGMLLELQNKGLINTSYSQRLVHRLYPELSALKAGTYQMQPAMSLEEVLKLMVSGKEYQFSLTLVEGSSWREWRKELANNPDLIHTMDALSDDEIANKLGIEHDSLEGLFLAETYHFTQGESDIELLSRAHRTLVKVLDSAWQTRAEKLPLATQYQALILASIVEKETAIADERPKVASVFINRLQRKMRLQTDPTVIYGLGEKYDGNITRRDLRTPTPYNTYVISGLPPTPIAMVGRSAIEAALQPEQTSYLYFVASGHGGHVFSKTLVEHNRAVKQYLKVLREK